MKTSILFISLLFLFFFNFICIGQEDDIQYNLVQVPPSPNSASLGKYCEVPVDLSTGVPSITIPLFSVNEGGINLPVTLNYHAGGIKVSEEASWVGLGWSLAPGGSISRTIRGLPDEHPGGFLNNCMKVPTERYVELKLLDRMKAGEMLYFLKDVADNKVDYEPDIFFFNTPSENGTFMFNNIAGLTTLPYKDFKILPYFDNSNLCGFKLTDANGIIYFFGDTLDQSNFVETTFSTSGGFHIQEYTSSWLIHSIINPLTGMKIDFSYSSFQTDSYVKTESKLYQRNTTFTGDYTLLSSTPFVINTRTNIKILKEISINQNKIYFITSSRNDVDGKKLDTIKFNDKCFTFKTDYFKVNSNSNDYKTLRLRLDEISEFDFNTPTRVKDHVFEYYYDLSTDVKLPSKDSYSIDHWGFYNGKNNNTAIPTINYGLHEFAGADRSPDHLLSKVCTLKRVEYPTGGSTEYIYENNTFARLPIIDEISETLNSEQAYLVSEEYNNDEISNSIPITFTSGYNYLNYRIHFSFQNSEPPPDPEFPIPGEFGLYIAKVKLFNVSENRLIYQATIDKDNFQDIDAPIEDIEPADSYTLTVTLKRAIGETYAELEYQRYNPDDLLVERDDYAGGIRIKQIINSSGSGINEFKTYDYSLSGYLSQQFPIYYTTSAFQTLNDQGNPVIYPRILTYASAVGGLGSSPNSVSYEKVIEYSGTENTNMGKKVSYFRHIADEPLSGEFSPIMNFQSKRSMPLKEEYFKNFGNQYELVKSINYLYEPDPLHFTSIEGFRSSVGLTGDNYLETDITSIMRYNKYLIAVDRDRLVKTLEWEKMNSGNIMKEVKYIYDSKIHLNPTKIITYLNSDHTEIQEELFKYPSDFLPEPIDCNSYYNQDIVDCQSILDSCQIELTICNTKFGECFAENLDCEDRRYIRYTEAFFPMVGWDPYNCYENEVECLNASGGYYDCVGGLQCGFMPCIINAALGYKSCEASNIKNILDLYHNCQDADLKNIYLLSLSNYNNTLIEKINKHNGVVTNHYFNNFKSLIRPDSSSIPVMKNSIDKLNNEILIVYDSIDQNSNIIQLTEKGQSPVAYSWGYNSKYLLSETLNATTAECGYTGFENEEYDGWLTDHTDFKFSESYTGNSSILIAGGSVWKEFRVGTCANDHEGYEASVWVKNSPRAFIEIYVKGNSSIRAYSDNEFGDENEWSLIRVVLPKELFENSIDSSFTLIARIGSDEGEAFFDDLRFHPTDAQMTSYTHKPLVGITSVSDMNNKAQIYEYDAFDRLIVTKDFQGNINNKYDYHYKPQQ